MEHNAGCGSQGITYMTRSQLMYQHVFGRKPENLEETMRPQGEHTKLQTDSNLSLRLTQGPRGCETATLPAVPLCRLVLDYFYNIRRHSALVLSWGFFLFIRQSELLRDQVLKPHALNDR